MRNAPLRFRLIKSFHQKHQDINLVAHVYSKMFISGFHASTKMIIEKSEDKVNLHIRKNRLEFVGRGRRVQNVYLVAETCPHGNVFLWICCPNARCGFASIHLANTSVVFI